MNNSSIRTFIIVGLVGAVVVTAMLGNPLANHKQTTVGEAITYRCGAGTNLRCSNEIAAAFAELYRRPR